MDAHWCYTGRLRDSLYSYSTFVCLFQKHTYSHILVQNKDQTLNFPSVNFRCTLTGATLRQQLLNLYNHTSVKPRNIKTSHNNVAVLPDNNPLRLRKTRKKNAYRHTHKHTGRKIKRLRCIHPRLRPHRRTPCWSWQRSPTSQSVSRYRGRPQASAPAAGCQRWGLQLKHTGRVSDTCCTALLPKANISVWPKTFQCSTVPAFGKLSVKIT